MFMFILTEAANSNIINKIFDLFVKVIGFIGIDLSKFVGSASQPISAYTLVEVLFALGLVYIGLLAVKAIFKTSKEGIVGFKRFANKRSKRNIAKKEMCNHCGRTLDKCACPDKKNWSLRKKLRNKRREERLRRKQERKENKK